MEANTVTMTIVEIRERLIGKAVEDETFRARLLADPEETVQDELGIKAPEGFTLMVHEETPSTSHLVLPPSGMLDETELMLASGAGCNGHWSHSTCW